jgi:hypothetical protein
VSGAAVALDVPHDEQAQRDARAVLEVLVPGTVVLDGTLEDLGVRPDRIGPIPPKRSRARSTIMTMGVVFYLKAPEVTSLEVITRPYRSGGYNA